MMSKIKVDIYCTSNSHFLQWIYTGFRMLDQQCEVELSYRIYKDHLPSPRLESLSYPMNLLVKVNDSKLVLFDMNDDGEIWKNDLEQVDFYFKRSFSAERIGAELAYKKIFPLGLSYVNYERIPSLFSIKRIFLERTPGKIVKSAIKTLGLFQLFSPRLYRQHVGNSHAEPDISLPPAVIFMTRLWNPKKYQGVNREIAEANNALRVACIRSLRGAFGDRFMGGLDPGRYAYSLPEFEDCLVKDASLCFQGNYIRLLKQYPIAVYTRGLANATGYKFGEYIAFSKAIVSEKLVFEAPGLESGKHYLEFSNAEECVAAVSALMNNENLRRKMMKQSQEYYQQYLPPDVAMRRILSIVLGDAGTMGMQKA